MRSASLSFFALCVSFVGMSFLAGCGGSGGAAVTSSPTGTAALTLSANSLAFASTTVGATSASQTVTLNSTGTGTATVSISAVTLSDTTDYSLASTCSGSYGLGTSCTLTVAFTPRSAASLPAIITITDSLANSPQMIALTGTGTAAPAPQVVLSPSTAAYASVITSASVQLYSGPTITLANPGTASLTGIGFSITGTGASVFSVASTTCTTTLAAGSSCTVNLKFAPTAVGAYNATLNVADNASGSPQAIPLTGTATTPGATLSASSIAFPSSSIGSTSVASSVTLTNSGTASLIVNGIALSGANPTAFATTNTCGTTLAIGASCSISATFTPSAAQAYSATITVTDTAVGSPQTITLTGTGTAPAATLSAISLTFAATNAGTTSTAQSITLTNSGTAALSVNSITLGGTNAANFAQTNNCPASLAASSNCTINVTFSPSASASYSAAITLTDGAANSPQTIALAGTGVAPAVTLSSTTVTFPSTTIGTTAPTQTVTLTNSGTAALTIGSITLGGTNATSFTEASNCPASLAVSAYCTLTLTFSPAAATTYNATVTLTDNSADSPQAVALTGTGTAATVTRTLYTFPATFPESLPDASVTQLYTLVNNAQKSIDMTMYELVDTTFSADLVNACTRGVKVRVLLDASLEKSSNTAAYNQLNTAGSNCSAVFSNTAFQATHEKSILIDGVTSVIMTLNLTSRYYTTTRDFAIVENDAADYAAIEATFNQDYAAGTPYGGTQGASDVSYTPTLGDDLIWSPTTAQAAMLAIINNAKSTLLIENEELSSSTTSTIVAALTSACQRGVIVHFTIVDQSSYEAQYTTLKNAGCSVHTYPNTTTGLYIHAKVVVADYGLSTQNVYMGSINYSSASMNQNRELGMYLSDNAAVQTLYTTLTSDYTGGTAW